MTTSAPHHVPTLARHTLVRVDPAAWTAELAARRELAAQPLLVEWAARQWPLVARRRCEKDADGHLALGLPLPPSHGKARVALNLPPSAVLETAPPLTLATVRATAPIAWHATIDALLTLAERFDTEPQVFGSFAMAALTGLDYVSPESDLDLLWPLIPQVSQLFAELPALEEAAPGRLDGEVVGAGGAVHWREFASDASEVLVKTINDVSLQPKAAFSQAGRADTQGGDAP